MAKRRRNAWLAGAALAGAIAGVALERTLVGRVRSRPDPESSEQLGRLRGAPVSPVTASDGTTLHVEIAGGGPTLVMAHGYSLELASWHYQIRDLPYRMVLYDQRGHGLSAPARNGDWSLEALARDLEAVVRFAGPEPVAIMAHSMGGMAALKFCELFPELLGSKVLGMVLVDTSAAEVVRGVVPLPARLNGLQEVALRAAVSLDRASVEKMRRRASDFAWLIVRAMGFGSNASPAQVAFVEKMLSDTSVDTWLSLLPAMTTMDMRPALAAIDIPVLVVVGTADRVTPVASAEALAGALKRAELAKISGAGHCPMIEAATSFNTRVKTFLASLPWPVSDADHRIG